MWCCDGNWTGEDAGGINVHWICVTGLGILRFLSMLSLSALYSNTWRPWASACRRVLRSESLGFSDRNFRSLNYPAEREAALAAPLIIGPPGLGGRCGLRPSLTESYDKTLEVIGFMDYISSKLLLKWSAQLVTPQFRHQLKVAFDALHNHHTEGFFSTPTLHRQKLCW